MKLIVAYILVIAAVLSTSFNGLKSQNLVPNPSFEVFTVCPLGPSEIFRATPWIQPTDSGTSDYFNACNISFIPGFPPPVGVPVNLLGAQAARTGVGYAGFYSNEAFFDNGYREYIQAPLLQPLEVGKTYCVQFYVSLSDNSNEASNGIGAFFSTYPIQQNEFNFNVQPQISVGSTVYTDMTNWVLINGSFVADSAYQYLTIGNFYGINQTTTIPVPAAGFPPIFGAYYYIDDVSVEEFVNTSAGIVGDTVICEGDFTTLTATGGSKYTWSTGDTTASITVKPADDVVYTVLIESVCSSVILQQNITVEQCKINAIIETDSDTICPQTCTALEVQVSGGVRPYYYQWDVPSALTDSVLFVCPMQDTTYTVIITDSVGSVADTASITIRLQECLVPLPNVFSPNQDGVNDLLSIPFLPNNTRITVYSRWGNVVYTSNNYQNDWDGGGVSDGVYYYVVTYPSGKTFSTFLHILQ